MKNLSLSKVGLLFFFNPHWYCARRWGSSCWGTGRTSGSEWSTHHRILCVPRGSLWPWSHCKLLLFLVSSVCPQVVKVRGCFYIPGHLPLASRAAIFIATGSLLPPSYLWTALRSSLPSVLLPPFPLLLPFVFFLFLPLYFFLPLCFPEPSTVLFSGRDPLSRGGSGL